MNTKNQSHNKNDKWTLLIVDDNADIHAITKSALSDYKFKNKKLKFVSAFSVEDAKTILKNDNNISIVLLDMVMEERTSGIDVVKYIRNELKSRLVQIILRTGFPGENPESELVERYEINDYKEKSELTIDKLYSTITTSLRNYSLLKDIYFNLDKTLQEKDELVKQNTNFQSQLQEVRIEEKNNTINILINILRGSKTIHLENSRIDHLEEYKFHNSDQINIIKEAKLLKSINEISYSHNYGFSEQQFNEILEFIKKTSETKLNEIIELFKDYNIAGEEEKKRTIKSKIISTIEQVILPIGYSVSGSALFEMFKDLTSSVF